MRGRTSAIIMFVFMLSTTLTLSGCGTWWLPRPHKINIQQGNILDITQIDTLSNGMTKADVINSIGRPITGSPFDKNRWDYLYSRNRSGEKPNPKALILYFENERITRIEKQGLEQTTAKLVD